MLLEAIGWRVGRSLLDSIPITRPVSLPYGTTVEAPCLVGLCDRALISVMAYAFGRSGPDVRGRAQAVVRCHLVRGRWLRSQGVATKLRGRDAP